MEKLPKVYEKRIASAVTRVIDPLLFKRELKFTVTAAEVEGEPIPYDEAIGLDFLELKEGGAWGARWDTTWFRFRAVVPADWSGERIVAKIDLTFEQYEGFGREGLVYLEGKPHTAVNRNRNAILLIESAQGGEEIDFYVEAASNPPAEWGWGKGDALLPEFGGDKRYELKTARLASYDADAFQLKMDFTICHQAMLELPASSPRRGKLLRVLNEVCTLLERQDRALVSDCRALLAPVIACKNGDTAHQITAVGHAHIDTAWCWPLRESIRKCARSFSTTLRLMEQYPDYHFVCSQPQQYAWMKQYYPSIYEDIQQAVKRGQWEPVGAMWIEADCNIPSGESLVRQIIHGKQFYQQEFGIDIQDLWLPDVFGYSASLPQILKKSGVDSFLTQKISWSDTNKFPHHTFEWQGIDGSEIFTHFPPVDTYNCFLEAADLRRAETNFTETDRATRSLVPFGHGDGGGGPTAEQLEAIRRFEDFEGLPKVKSEPLTEFFEKAKEDAVDLPRWKGELYLELHRGTLTSQAFVKMANRRGEHALRDAEFLQVIAHLLDPGELLSENPAAERAVYDVPAFIDSKSSSVTNQCLDRAWKLLLLNQFHDIIPGSSINWVYQDARKDYQVIDTITSAVINAAAERVVKHIDTSDFKTPAVIFNTLASERTEVVEVADQLQLVTVPQCGYRVVSSEADLDHSVVEQAVEVEQQADQVIINNGLVKLSIDSQGCITSLLDIEQNREVISAGEKANLFQLHTDIPNFWNAWDVDVFYKDNVLDLDTNGSVEIMSVDKLRVEVSVKRSFGSSTIEQIITVNAGSKRVEFSNTVDWQESNKLLKVAFPVDVHSLRASYDVQFGHVERPTHTNTSWDVAKFEVPVHRWADLSEGDYGVALLNDSKYGMDIHGHTMRLTLLKAANAPDPLADKGLHTFEFAIYPHKGNLQQSDVVDQALAFNSPLIIHATDQHEGVLAASDSFLTVNKDGVQLSAMKLAEQSNEIITRVYETKNTRGALSIDSELLPSTMTAVDLLERPNGDSTEFIKPFEILSQRWS